MKIDYKYVLDSVADGVIIADIKSKRFIYANKKICEFTGYDMEEFLQKGVMDIHPKTDMPYVIEQFEKQVKGEITLAADLPVLKKDGTILICDVSAISMGNGEQQYIIGLFRDVTERKKVEEKIALSEAILKAQLETSVDGILAVDDEGKTLLFNKRFGELWRIPQDVLNSKNDERMLNYVLDQLKDPTAFIEKVKYLYKHTGEKSFDELEFKDGRFFERYSSPLIGANGKYYGRIWYFRDITAHRTLDVELKTKLREMEIYHRATMDREKRILELKEEIKKLKNEGQKFREV